MSSQWLALGAGISHGGGMKGYFGIGVERVSKAMNVGALFRTAHAFGASFVFTVAAQYRRGEAGHADTSDTPGHVPLYEFATVEALRLPRGCKLVGVEITEQAVELPSFHHPRQAAYVLGAEREGLSEGLQAICDHMVKIPTRFSLNLAVAGALIMYDRTIALGRFPARPLSPAGKAEPLPAHRFGEPIYVRKHRRKAAAKKA